MLIIPAIDLKDKKVVRLVQGKPTEVTVYSDDPMKVARNMAANGARLLHVVDLDGALTGEMMNLEGIVGIAKSVGIPIEVGGGIRSEKTITGLFEFGVAKVILGTRAIEDKEFLQKVLNRWRDRIIISIDASHGRVFGKGWTQASGVTTADLTKQVKEIGAQHIIYTDISRDGTLTGPNIKGIESLLDAAQGMKVFASGGMSSIEDVKALLSLEPKGLCGVIIGKALYEGKIDLREAINCAR